MMIGCVIVRPFAPSGSSGADIFLFRSRFASTSTHHSCPREKKWRYIYIYIYIYFSKRSKNPKVEKSKSKSTSVVYGIQTIKLVRHGQVMFRPRVLPYLIHPAGRSSSSSSSSRSSFRSLIRWIGPFIFPRPGHVVFRSSGLPMDDEHRPLTHRPLTHHAMVILRLMNTDRPSEPDERQQVLCTSTSIVDQEPAVPPSPWGGVRSMGGGTR